jgi:hypothetical protein
MLTTRARLIVGGAIAALVAAVIVLAGLNVIGAINGPGQPDAPSTAQAVKRDVPTQAGAAGIPVLVYHEMNNGCAASAPVCDAQDPESVSTTQFTRQMNYLRGEGYHSVTLNQYLSWLADPHTVLPRKPILLTADNGIGNFLQGAQPILARNGFTMTAFIVTGFADGASGLCQAPRRVAGRTVDFQPGCGKDNRSWDLTWAQLRALNPAVYSFAFEAGASGHFPQNYARKCFQFYACKVPGETTRSYETRVVNEINAGLSELSAKLPGRVDTRAWVVPFSDLGYQRCGQPDCTPQNSTGQRGWLSSYAASRFSAVFVEDAFRNRVQNERFRFDITGGLTQQEFQAQLRSLVASASFAR